ncbi:phage baseplate assembly protein V [Acidicapsa acidisoli]|uniref:phage baseplate assembly protein V n=1 Tax=Acidicapsa acidisoli TaxID=1615681 RepID=UPI0021E07987|nr:phage baseplate assembly protein V [Acidicapsa acidisoli]
MSGTTGTSSRRKFYGKYKGVVESNVDADRSGRLLVSVPDALGSDPCIWAESASPLAGTGMGLYFVPPIGSGVWIEFQQGDSDFAMWTGCWRGSSADVPVLANSAPPEPPPIVLGSNLGNSIVISDVPGPTGGISIISNTGAAILINDAGITISNGKGAMITLMGTAVDINTGGLTVLK